MKFVKALALLLTICMLGTALIACDKENVVVETAEAGEPASVKITLKVCDGSIMTVKYEDAILCNGTLENAIIVLSAGYDYEGEEYEKKMFNDSGILTQVCKLEAKGSKSWKAFYEEEGVGNAFESIKTAKVEDGRTVVLLLD